MTPSPAVLRRLAGAAAVLVGGGAAQAALRQGAARRSLHAALGAAHEPGRAARRRAGGQGDREADLPAGPGAVPGARASAARDGNAAGDLPRRAGVVCLRPARPTAPGRPSGIAGPEYSPCFAGFVRRGGTHPADCLVEHCKSAAGTQHRTQQRDCSARRIGSITARSHTTTPRRSFITLDCRRGIGTVVVQVGDFVFVEAQSCHAAARRSAGAGCSSPNFRFCNLAAYWNLLRTSAGIPEFQS